MSTTTPSLNDILDMKTSIDVVDIGANPIDGDTPYKPLLDIGFAKVVGFEPNEDALAELNKRKGPNESYIGKAVFDGGNHQLKVCKSPGMTSLLEPNQEVLQHFHGFPEWGEVIERVPVSTVRLDDVSLIKNVDYLKIDIQGGELEVFRNGMNRLSDCLVIHTEVEFLQMYEGQPLFSEVELFLRDLGFVFHRFFPLVSRTLQPMVVNNDIYAGFSQIFWADAVFVKDFTKFELLRPHQLKKLALILHDIYGSYDVVLQALIAHDKKSDSKLANRYLGKAFEGRDPR